MASWNDRSWPLRKWIADRLIGRRKYSRNVHPTVIPPHWNTSSSQGRVRILPFDQERS